MAHRRMISLEVVDTDKFACMTLPARYLYFELLVRADDDGFVGAPTRVVRMVGCSSEELEELVDNGYVIKFESGIIVICDWRLQNTVRKDMYKETLYQTEFQMLNCSPKGRYYLKKDNVTCDVTYNVTCGGALGKYSIGKDSIDKDSIIPEAENLSFGSIEASFILEDGTMYDVTREEVEKYRGLYPDVDIMQELRKIVGWCDANPDKRKTRRGAKRFLNGWLSRSQNDAAKTGTEATEKNSFNNFEQRTYDFNDLERKLVSNDFKEDEGEDLEDDEGWIDFAAMSDEEYAEFLKKEHQQQNTRASSKEKDDDEGMDPMEAWELWKKEHQQQEDNNQECK